MNFALIERRKASVTSLLTAFLASVYKIANLSNLALSLILFQGRVSWRSSFAAESFNIDRIFAERFDIDCIFLHGGCGLCG